MKIKHIDISIVIVNYRSWEVLKTCLTSLDKISFRHTKFEVIVVDNFSNDGNLKQFKKDFSKFTFLLNSANCGFSHACNLGANHSKGSFLLFLNPDTIIHKDALKTLYTTAKNNPELRLLSCNKVNLAGKPEVNNKPFPSLINLFGITRAIYGWLHSRKAIEVQNTGNKIILCSWLSGSLIIMSKQWYEKIGGWNENYWMYYEDVDLSKRTKDLNGIIAVIENISVVHSHGGASRLNQIVKGLTKAEVIISKHVYISENFNRYEKTLAHILLFLSVVFSKTILFAVGSVFYFKPKLHVHIYIFKNLVSYYFHALKNRTWLSERSVNFRQP